MEERSSGSRDGEREDRHRRNKKRPSVGRALLYSIKIGFFAGIIWGLARWLAVSLNLTRVPQAFLADPWVRRTDLNSVFWHCTGLALFVIMSVVAALLYYLILGRLQGPWPGIVYGAVWWALLYLAIGPPTGMTESVRVIGWNSIACELGLYLCWGLFIGYSIAFEFHDEAAREPAGKSGKSGGGRERGNRGGEQPAT